LLELFLRASAFALTTGREAASETRLRTTIYTGGWQFTVDDKGLWTFLVIAQDMNDATPNMTPEEAAQIIGGMVLTHQLSITFEGGTCPLVPDGHVNVV
jgi:hypothetical protein